MVQMLPKHGQTMPEGVTSAETKDRNKDLRPLNTNSIQEVSTSNFQFTTI